jgi:hypothetical protein
LKILNKVPFSIHQEKGLFSAGDKEEVCPDQWSRLIIAHREVFKLNGLPCRIVDGFCPPPKIFVPRKNV